MAETSRSETGGPNPLDDFLNAAESFVKNTSAAMIKAAGDHEDGLLIEGTSRMVIAQFAAVCGDVRATYASTNPAARRDADKLLSIQQGALLARIGEETAKAALAKGPGGGFFAWVSQHLEELKKLIKFIVKALHGGIEPPWIDEILRLIDELWDLISSLLGGVFGLNRREIGDEISARAVNTMNELAALARLQNVRPAPAFDNGD
jgi:hypothetical protein